jgi:hypothetical protein
LPAAAAQIPQAGARIHRPPRRRLPRRPAWLCFAVVGGGFGGGRNFFEGGWLVLALSLFFSRAPGWVKKGGCSGEGRNETRGRDGDDVGDETSTTEIGCLENERTRSFERR